MVYNKKIAPTLLTNSGGFTILKAQRHLIPGKYATIGGSMVHILICDDDAVFAQDMAKKILALPAYSPKSMNVQCLTDVNAMSAGELTKFDILFLDIDLGDKNVIELARTMRVHNAEAVLILVTNFSEYAPEGYEVDAFRYLPKQNWIESCPAIFRMPLSFAVPASARSKFFVKEKACQSQYRRLSM